MTVKPVSGNIYLTSHGLVIVTGENKNGIQWISAGCTRSGGTTQLTTTTTTVPCGDTRESCGSEEYMWDDGFRTVEHRGVDQWQKMGDTLQDYIQKSLLKNFGF